ncbi:hypothetical protein L7F22_020857 [Adiantum nelumboides]|nr:hypothetical protein [Adiantum nelumboides]
MIFFFTKTNADKSSHLPELDENNTKLLELDENNIELSKGFQHGKDVVKSGDRVEDPEAEPFVVENPGKKTTGHDSGKLSTDNQEGMDVEMADGPIKSNLYGGPFSAEVKDLPKKHAVEAEELFDIQEIGNLVPQHNIAPILEKLGGVNEVIHQLRSDVDKGIDDDLQGIDERRKLYGSNNYSNLPSSSFCSCVKITCKNIPLMLLLLCGLAELGLKIRKGKWHHESSLLVVIISIISIKSCVIYKQELHFSSIEKKRRDIMQVEVMRGGKKKQVSYLDIVIGDMVFLKNRDQVPADGLLIKGHLQIVDKSSAAERKSLIHVSPNEPYLFSGSKVCHGYGVMVVTGVGISTKWGQLMAAQPDAVRGKETQLQSKVRGGVSFAKNIGALVCIVVFAAVFFHGFIAPRKGSEDSWSFKLGQTSAVNTIETFLNIIQYALINAIVLVPEGLPLAVSCSLAHATKNLIANRVLTTGKLGDFENMGHVTSVCTDIRGSLTLDEMVVTKVWAAGEMRDPTTGLQHIGPYHRALIAEAISQNSTGNLLSMIQESDGEPEMFASPTETAALLWGSQSGLNYEYLRVQSTVLEVKSFDSTKKIAGVALCNAEIGKVHVHWKGAARPIVDRCEKVICLGDSIEEISPSLRSNVLSVIEGLENESLHCVAFSCREMDHTQVPSCDEMEKWKIPEDGLILFAVLGMKNPCRPEVFEAIHQCQAAGIKIRMITGDSLAKSKAIATDCGILNNGCNAVEASTFQNYPNAVRKSCSRKLEVMAGSSPTDVSLLISTLRENNEVVAVISAEVSDGLSFQTADQGPPTLGHQGTEVAARDSYVIIVGDDFPSVVHTIRWSRVVYLNTQKFLQFQVAPILTIGAVNVVSVLYTGDLSLTVAQLLWVSLLVVLGMLALAREPPSIDILVKPPVGINEPLMSNIMWRNLILQGFYQMVVLLLLQYTHLLKLGSGKDADDVKRTVLFNVLVFCQAFNLVNARESEKMNIFQGILRNWLLLGVEGGIVVSQIVLVEFLGMFASTAKLSWQYWVVSVLLGFLSWPVAMLGKLDHVPKRLVLDGPYNAACQRRPEMLVP